MKIAEKHWRPSIGVWRTTKTIVLPLSSSINTYNHHARLQVGTTINENSTAPVDEDVGILSGTGVLYTI